MTRDEQRAMALDLIYKMSHEGVDADARRMNKFAVHGAARLAFRLKLIDFEEWTRLDHGERVTT